MSNCPTTDFPILMALPIEINRIQRRLRHLHDLLSQRDTIEQYVADIPWLKEHKLVKLSALKKAFLELESYQVLANLTSQKPVEDLSLSDIFLYRQQIQALATIFDIINIAKTIKQLPSHTEAVVNLMSKESV